MNIIHINLFDFQGGSARIAGDLTQAATLAGHNVHVFAHRKSTDNPQVTAIPLIDHPDFQQLLEEQRRQGLFDLFATSLLGVFSHGAFQSADVVHLHCINGGYFSYLLLPFLASKPLVWTFHDPLGVTAQCLYPQRCDRWQQDFCSQCPIDAQAGIKNQGRPFMQKLKRDLLQVCKFTAVAPSRWMENNLRQGIVDGQDIRLIYNGVDTEIYRPADQGEVRRQLKLPLDKKIIMFAAHGGLNSAMKGGQYLLDALKMLSGKHPDWLLLNVGTRDQSILNGLNMPVVSLPFIDDPGVMAQYYAASDVFISTTLTETFGLTICEAMSCGIPVISFASGGTPELVVHGETGQLIQTGDLPGLAAGLERMLADAAYCRKAGEASRERVLDLFGLSKMNEAYLRLYQEISQ